MLQHTLIVDDSLPLHKIVKAQLGEDDLQFHSAYDGASGLAMTAKIRPSLILLDIDMPDMDGFEVCRRLKDDTETAGIPVIFLTADFSTHDKVKGLDLGAVDYVTKPFKPMELSARVRAALRSKQMIEQNAMIDGLTGLWNKEYFQARLAAEVEQAAAPGRALACILSDVDGLNRLNQKFGVSFGDEILRSVGAILQHHGRADDAICRCDGGKFGILLPGTNRSEATRLAEHLCIEVRRQLLTHGGNEVGVTCSFGVVDNLVAPDGLVIERAELALIRAKQKGGNCVTTARTLRKELSDAA